MVIFYFNSFNNYYCGKLYFNFNPRHFYKWLFFSSAAEFRIIKMPRIDPLQLLKCLSVLLTPEGGILSRDEVPRLVNLMTKFSKKLVSKCVYVLILKGTETELVDMFMAEGGWTLIQTWLQDAVQTANWDLVQEILGLLLVTPVDVERLKLNILPKLIKSLSRREELEGVADLSAQLVQQWLTIVKGSSSAAAQAAAAAAAKAIEAPEVQPVTETPIETINTKLDKMEVKDEAKIEYVDENTNAEVISTETFYKSTGKSGKLVIRKFPVDENKDEVKVAKDEEIKEDKEDDKEKNKDRRLSTGSNKSSKSSSSRSSSSSKDKSRSKDDDKDKKSSSSSKSSSHSSGKSKDKDKKDKDKNKERDRDKDRHRRNGEVKSSSSSSSKSSKDKKDSRDKDKDKDKSKHKSDKNASKDKKDKQDDDKQAEKDKDTLAKLIPPPIDKLGRIPKKSSSSSTTDEEKEKKEMELKKKSFSVGIRKDRDTTEERPKTVKVFNSKMRSTGLEEEIKPAPPRPTTGKKPTPSVQLPTIPQKRPSPPKEIRDPIVPPEKKIKIDKIDVPERPGSIKLIPPKPKPMLQESDLFNDALTAATTKKEQKKRKRRASISKDKETPTSPSSSPANEPPATPTPPTTPNVNSSTLGLKNIAPINFYQDTLSSEEVEENKDNKENNDGKDDENKENASENVEEKTSSVVPDADDAKIDTPSSPPKTPTDDKDDEPLEPKKQRLDGGLKGVLLYTKKRGPKKSISWKHDTDLVEIRYFELDETERVNVTKTFGDMAKMDISGEREAIQLSRKIGGEDLMEAQINWRVPFLLELEEPLAVPGSKSLEKDIQFAREKSVLQALYFDKRRIPDSPEEPIPENHQMSDPVLILLEDPESQEYDLRNTPWPEPKGLPPAPEPKPVPPVFQNMPVPFQPPFNNMTPPNFQGLQQRFVAPGGPMGPIGPGNFIPPTMMAPNNVMVPPNMGPTPHDMMNMNPNMFPHGPGLDNFVPGPENFGPMHDGFGMPGNDCFVPPVQEGFGPGPGPDGFGPGPDYPMFPNQNPPNNMNMFHPNKFRDHRPNNRGNFRRGGGGNSGGWKQISGNSNWKKGRGGRLCKNVQNHGFCRNRDNCPFVHP